MACKMGEGKMAYEYEIASQLFITTDSWQALWKSVVNFTRN